ncbi:hypothetical protein BV25DRAFT_946672 [Artomyces pyxidatus]|uniref:Uncharacterized protein n=1 Tax=Artomyces pyxidatus TaxID=48021 RepID=A0ACB8SXM0_9AGAM|nr:hypothetical protein BV25DRAFT_946672 [Artomyces pyxidatus]
MTAFRATPVSRITNEILRRIFSLTYDEWTYGFGPHSELQNFALVNKRWHSVALLELYTHVYIGYQYREEAWQGHQQFHSTLQCNPLLASTVRSIWYTLAECDAEENETEILAKALSLCKNLVRFVARGWHYERESLIDALSASKKLQTVDLSLHGFDIGDESEPFCSVSRFFSMLQGWPEIQHVVIESSTISADADDEESDLDANSDSDVSTAIACPSLRRFDFPSESMLDSHLTTLSHIAPSITHLTLDISNISDDSLLSALECWRNSLESLSLDEQDRQTLTDYYPKINTCIASLPNLHTLDVNWVYVSPKSFSRGKFPELSTFSFRMRSEDLVPLTDALRDTDCLSSLRTFELRRSNRIGAKDVCDAKLVQSLLLACKQRGLECDVEI